MKKYLTLIILNSFLFLLDGILLLVYLITKNQELVYILGVCTGLFVSSLVISLISIIVLKKKSSHGQFDERQLKNRGDCFCVSFFFLLICICLDGFIRNITNYDWSSYFVGVFTWCMLSIGVFTIMCIWKDAYVTIGENKIRLCIFFGIIGLLDIIVGIVCGLQNSFIVDGKLDVSFVNLFGGFILLVIAANLIIKYKIDQRKVFIEDEEFETKVC